MLGILTIAFEGVGILWFIGWRYALGWLIFWLFIALWNALAEKGYVTWGQIENG